MSIFASRTTKTIEILFDPPHVVTIVKLAGRHLERASQENTFGAVDTLKRLGGPAFQKELASVGDPEAQAAAVKKRQADPLNAYDPYVLLRFGIKAWTYDESLVPVNVIEESGVSVSRIAAIEDLDEEAVDFLAREILRLSKPSLFVDADAAAVAEKNASPALTGT